MISAACVSIRTPMSSYAHQNGEATMTQSDEDRDQAFFGGDTGLKVSDRKIKASSSSEFTLLVCLTLDSSGTSFTAKCQNPVRDKSHFLSTHKWAESTVWVILCVWLLYWCTAVWFLTVMMWGLHKLTDRKRENVNKNRRWGKKKMRATEPERGKKSHTAKQQWTIADLSCSVVLFPFCLFSLRLSPLVSLSSPPLSASISVLQSRVTGRCHLTRHVSQVHSHWGNGVSYL